MAKNSQLEKKYKKPKVARAPIASAPITTTQFIAPRPASVQETAAAATASFAHPADAYYRDVQPAQKASTLSWNPYDYYKAYELYVPTQTATPTATSIVPILPSLLPVRSNPTIASTQTTASQPIISQSQPIRTAATTPLTQPSQSNYSSMQPSQDDSPLAWKKTANTGIRKRLRSHHARNGGGKRPLDVSRQAYEQGSGTSD